MRGPLKVVVRSERLIIAVGKTRDLLGSRCFDLGALVIIPADRWKDPYMPVEELENEIAHGVRFSGIEVDGVLVGIMGVLRVNDVTLIRHAYVAQSHRNKGLGGVLLEHLLQQTTGPLLVGTWAAATWAIRFYENHGFRQVSSAEKDQLLRTYWSIPERQVETSVVLVNAIWTG